jgi:hypothetical protein
LVSSDALQVSWLRSSACANTAQLLFLNNAVFCLFLLTATGSVRAHRCFCELLTRNPQLAAYLQGHWWTKYCECLVVASESIQRVVFMKANVLFHRATTRSRCMLLTVHIGSTNESLRAHPWLILPWFAPVQCRSSILTFFLGNCRCFPNILFYFNCFCNLIQCH